MRTPCCLLLLPTMLMSAYGCGSDPGEGAASTKCDQVALPEPSPATGQFVFSLAPEVDPCGVDSYVVGFKDQLKSAYAGAGRFFISNVPAGLVDVVIQARSPSAAGALTLQAVGEESVGIRLSDEKLLAGIRTEDPSPVSLGALSSLSGTATLLGQTDHAGINVYIPGTSYGAQTDAAGSYDLSGVPAGKHNIYFEKDGYHRAQLEALILASGTSMSVPETTLVLSTGAEGFLLIEEGRALVDQLDVSLTIGATDDARLMKISEADTFLGASWQPMRSTSSYRFSSEGPKTLYIKFADANGLESSPFAATVTIDRFDAAEISLTPVAGALAPPTAPTFDFVVGVPAHAVQMAIFEGATPATDDWNIVTTSGAIAFASAPSSCGLHTVHVAFRDEDFLVSESAASTVDVSCWQTIPGYSGDFSSGANAGVATPGGLLVLDGTGARAGVFGSGASDWSDVSDPPLYLFGAVGAWTTSGAVFAAGYLDGDPFQGNQTLLIYEPGTDSWTSVVPANTLGVRSRACAVWTGDKLLVWGGERSQGSGAGLLNDGASYEFGSNSWTAISVVGAPSGRMLPNCWWSGTELFVTGGEAASDPVSRKGAAYNPGNDTWRDISDSPVLLGAGTGGAWNGQYFFHHEFIGAGFALPRLAVYEPLMDQWRLKDAIPVPFQISGRPIGAWVGGRMALVNGSNGVLFDPLPYTSF